jgi:hypothetical protein
MVEMLCSSVALESIYQTKRQQNPEDCSENLKCLILFRNPFSELVVSQVLHIVVNLVKDLRRGKECTSPSFAHKIP